MSVRDLHPRRFQWLSSGDVQVKQKLLNYLRQREKELVVVGVQEQLPVMLKHLHMDKREYTHRMAQVLKVGKHELEITIDRDASGVRLENPAPPISASSSVTVKGDYSWLWWVGIVVAVLFFLIA